MVEAIETIRELMGKVVVFGICLGHQLISLANGANTVKLKFGHRGCNHPVLNLETGKVEMTSQNHGYAVEMESLKNTDLVMTHQALNDKSVGRCASCEISCLLCSISPRSCTWSRRQQLLI